MLDFNAETNSKALLFDFWALKIKFAISQVPGSQGVNRVM